MDALSTDRCVVTAFVKNSEMEATARYQCTTPRVVYGYLNGYAELPDNEVFQFGTHVQLITCDGTSLTLTYPIPRGVLPSIVRASAGFDQGQVDCIATPSVLDNR